MSKKHTLDDLLLAAYLDGTADEDQVKVVRDYMAQSETCRQEVAQIVSLMEGLPETTPDDISVPASWTQRAMSLFDSHRESTSALSIAIGFVGGLLRPLADSLQPSAMQAAAIRGEAARTEELSYHVTLGGFSLTVEVNSFGEDEVELSVQPKSVVPPGWTIRLIEGSQTRTVSSFNHDGIHVSALGKGVYTVALEHRETRAHQFHLRVVDDDLN